MSPAIDATDINLNGDALGINPANPGQPPSAMGPGGGSPLAAGYIGKMDALNADMQGEFSASQREQSPYRQKLQQVLDSPNAAAAHLEKAKAEPKPEDYRKHTMEFATGMALMGALAGRFTRMSGQTALAAFGGAMKGWQEGNLQTYETAAKEWDQATKKTLENNKIELEKYKAVMADKALNIDQLMASMNLIATEHQNKIMFDSTMAKNYTMALGAVDKLEAAHTKLENGTAKLNEIRTKQRSETVAAVEDLLAHPEKTAQMSLKDYQKLKGDAAVLGLNIPDQTESKGSQPRSMPAIVMEKWRKEHPNATAQDAADFAAHYGAENKATRDFATGPQGNAIRSFSVAIDHLGTAEEIGKALQTNDVTALNRIKNAVQQQFGYEGQLDFNFAKKIVGDEITKSILGSGAGTGQDRQDIQAAFSAANSPQQLSGVVKTAKRLMAGQLRGLKQQYEQTTGQRDFDERLSEQARGELEGLSGPPQSGGRSVEPGGSNWSKPKQVIQNGHTYELQPDGSYK